MSVKSRLALLTLATVLLIGGSPLAAQTAGLSVPTELTLERTYPALDGGELELYAHSTRLGDKATSDFVTTLRLSWAEQELTISLRPSGEGGGAQVLELEVVGATSPTHRLQIDLQPGSEAKNQLLVGKLTEAAALLRERGLATELGLLSQHLGRNATATLEGSLDRSAFLELHASFMLQLILVGEERAAGSLVEEYERLVRFFEPLTGGEDGLALRLVTPGTGHIGSCATATQIYNPFDCADTTWGSVSCEFTCRECCSNDHWLCNQLTRICGGICLNPATSVALCASCWLLDIVCDGSFAACLDECEEVFGGPTPY